MVVVDPRLTVTASQGRSLAADPPGTDMALALAMAQHILANDLHDRHFCAQHVLGFERWRDFILARLHAGLGGADHRHPCGRDPPARRGDRRRRRLRDLREPRHQPAHERRADQPRC
jgi:anaerobic selenocysteine-containing dehydrogenase